MTERISMDDVRARAINVNRRLRDTGRGVVAEQRNGGVALDEYSVAYHDGDSGPVGGRFETCIRTITAGSKREVYEFLHAMMVGIDLSRSEDWRVQG